MNIETRILAVCDVYDALVSDRVYRAAWTPERAFGLLEEESHAYDQTVVDALKRVIYAAAGDQLGRRPGRPCGRRGPRRHARPRAPRKRLSSSCADNWFAITSPLRVPRRGAVR